MLFTGVTFTFLKAFIVGVWLTAPLLLSIASVITVLGQVAGKMERWSRLDSFYWSFIAATTVRYGDIRPTRSGSRIIAIVIAVLGLTVTGIFVALAVHAATLAL